MYICFHPWTICVISAGTPDPVPSPTPIKPLLLFPWPKKVLTFEGTHIEKFTLQDFVSGKLISNNGMI